jgi:predicted  nucleic acid-binding Zn-ribbon protein
VVTAAPQDQWRLLDLQANDTRLAQLAHRRRTLPEEAEVERVRGRLKVIADRLIAARTVASDIARELAKAEADVELVRQRMARDRGRLDAGLGSAKDLQAIQHELDSLAQRQSVLEDAELEVMERLETAEARTEEVTVEQKELAERLTEVVAVRDRLVAEIDSEVAAEQRARTDVAAGLPADLLALYEKVRESVGGVGAARLYQRCCEGCRLELNTTELNRISAAAPDAVVRCEECRRILVRTPDSGL